MHSADIKTSDVGISTNMVTGSSKDNFSSDIEEPPVAYRMSWRTALGVLALSICWAATTFGVVGPNSAIGYMVADFPSEVGKASWIANAPLLGLVTIPAIVGAASDRYGKKWFLLVGAIISIVGTVVSSVAGSLVAIIGGQAITGVGNALQIICVAAGMEIVPAKHRVAVIATMSVINVSVGVFGGLFSYAGSIHNGLSWRWGFHAQSIINGASFLAILFFYHPPPTRMRREMTFLGLLKSIDFVGIFLLALGSALIVVALVWGGTSYAWNSAHIVPFLVIGGILLVCFGVYEWKFRADGIMHHEFFASRNFIVFLAYTFVDGLLLYATSVFIPDQINALYTQDPLNTAIRLVGFFAGLISGFCFFGLLTSYLQKFRFPLFIGSGFLTLFCGLAIHATPENSGFYEAMICMVGFFTAITEVLPVAGVGLVVPSYLIATSNTVLVVVRALGGALSIAIFSAIYRNKASVDIPRLVVPILTAAKIPDELQETVLTIALAAPGQLAKLPFLSSTTLREIFAAIATGSAESYRWVWVCITVCAFACMLLSLLIKEMPEHMTNHVESALERSEINTSEEKIV